MSNFPGSLDTDATLYVAKDNITTTLSVALAPGDTSVVLASGTGWAANMIASIELEQMLVTSVLGQVLTVTRAFGGTSAVAHAAGKTVANLVDAAYQSAAKSAIIAIETALGPNLVNVPVSPDIKANTYAFAPQSPGGSLGIGANTITLSPMPAGLNADAVNTTWLYISGGVGTAEAVPVIGVAATTVTVTCANTHSGAWTIQSATAGISEAINTLPATGGTVRLSGKYLIYGPILVKKGGVRLLGDAAGWAGSVLYGGPDRTNTQIYAANGSNLAWVLKVMRGSFVLDGIEIAGNQLNQTGGTGYGIWITSEIGFQNYCRLQNFNIIDMQGDGMRITAEAGFVIDVGSLTNFVIRDCIGNCMYLDSAFDWTFINMNMGGAGTGKSTLTIASGGTYGFLGGVLDTAPINLITLNGVNRVQFTNIRGDSSGQHAVGFYGNNTEVTFSQIDFEDYGTSAAGTYAAFGFVNGAQDFVSITNVRARNRVTVFGGYGISFAGGTQTGLVVAGCDFRNLVHTAIAGSLPVDATFRDNFGLNLPTLVGAALTPAAGVLTVTNRVHHVVTGAGAIGRIQTDTTTLVLYSEQLYLIFDGPAPGTLTTGDNIKRAVTPAAGQLIVLTYDSATGFWYPAA